jgi:RNA polymerase sigma factor (sigma-70 family)
VPLQAPGGSTNQAGVDPTAPEPTPSANARADEQSRLVLEALNKLPDLTNREIIRLRFLEGLSLRQIAQQLNLTYDIVRERFKLTKKRLQRDLEDLQ